MNADVSSAEGIYINKKIFVALQKTKCEIDIVSINHSYFLFTILESYTILIYIYQDAKRLHRRCLCEASGP